VPETRRRLSGLQPCPLRTKRRHLVVGGSRALVLHPSEDLPSPGRGGDGGVGIAVEPGLERLGITLGSTSDVPALDLGPIVADYRSGLGTRDQHRSRGRGRGRYTRALPPVTIPRAAIEGLHISTYPPRRRRSIDSRRNVENPLRKILFRNLALPLPVTGRTGPVTGMLTAAAFVLPVGVAESLTRATTP
jgi:hypothetical protein